ncbi:AAA family ATPase [Pannus brasiliensis CCIBt3594]|uniref:AAA family ATPase n=1 Tax=Pannus brasiliensis CCIBt3594 TaxID=1427578 RepID=A0AAW9QZB4_9CHRO
MIKDIEIQNFRCFEHTKIEGFERVNLIGGKNNAGKTAFLEALIVADNPDNILYLKDLRREAPEISRVLPEQMLQNLYFEQKSNRAISFKIKNNINIDFFINTSIAFYEDFFSLPEESLSDFKSSESIDRVLRSFIEQGSNIPPILEINSFSEKMDSENFTENISHHILFVDTEGYVKAVVNSGLLYPFTTHPENLHFLPIVPVFTNRSRSEIAQDYERLILQEEKEQQSEVLKAFQILDPNIEKIESFSLGSPNLYLTRTGGRRLPIALFGDAINRLAGIILKLLNNNSSILLIDEIENGIHYTNQKEFWQMLFRLATELDTQIFATTHSIEMIRAFADVGLEHYPEQGAYFELFRSPRTDKIMGVKRDLETLDYALKHDKEVRGER